MTAFQHGVPVDTFIDASYCKGPVTQPVDARLSFITLGILQIVCGACALILAIVAIIVQIWSSEYGIGFCSGVCFIIAGISGIALSLSKKIVIAIMFLMFSTISAILAVALLSLSAIGLASEDMLFHSKYGVSAALAVHSLLIVVAVLESGAALISCARSFKILSMHWATDVETDIYQVRRLPGRHFHANDETARFMPQTYVKSNSLNKTGSPYTVVQRPPEMAPSNCVYPSSDAINDMEINAAQVLSSEEDDAVTATPPPGTPPPSYSTLVLNLKSTQTLDTLSMSSHDATPMIPVAQPTLLALSQKSYATYVRERLAFAERYGTNKERLSTAKEQDEIIDLDCNLPDVLTSRKGIVAASDMRSTLI